MENVHDMRVKFWNLFCFRSCNRLQSSLQSDRLSYFWCGDGMEFFTSRI